METKHSCRIFTVEYYPDPLGCYTVRPGRNLSTFWINVLLPWLGLSSKPSKQREQWIENFLQILAYNEAQIELIKSLCDSFQAYFKQILLFTCYLFLGLLFNPEDGGSTSLEKASELIPEYMVSHSWSYYMDIVLEMFHSLRYVHYT
jgi:hypothetical protein